MADTAGGRRSDLGTFTGGRQLNANPLGGTADTSMNLETDAGRKLANPSASQIAEELEALSGRADSYAILSRDERSYIQAAGGPSEGFLLEYQEGSIEQHYRSTQSNLPLITVTNAFQLYAAHDSSWRSLVPWEHDDLSQHSGGLRLLPLFLIAAALAGLALWWWRAAS